MISKEKGLTPIARKLYTVLLWETQQQMKDLGRVPEATHLFEMPLRRALLLAGGSAESRTIAQGYLREMRRMSITWESPGATNGPEWTDMAFLSHASFEMKNGERYVQWALPPELVKALLNPKIWTLQFIPILAKLDSYAAIALYDICSRYKNNPTGVTNRGTPDWWVAALSSSSKVREWRKVKNESVLAAMQEINDKTDIEVELLEHKVGRAVAEVQFAVRKKGAGHAQSPEVDSSGYTPGLERVAAAAKGLSLTPDQLEGLVTAHSEERLLVALADLRRRVANENLAPVRNQLTYLKSIMQPGDAPQAEAPEVEVFDPIDNRKRQSLVHVQTVEDEGATARQERFNVAVAAIGQMHPAERRALIQELAADLKAKGQLTPSMARRVREEDWTQPLLKAEMVKRYWAQLEAAGEPGP